MRYCRYRQTRDGRQNHGYNWIRPPEKWVPSGSSVLGILQGCQLTCSRLGATRPMRSEGSRSSEGLRGLTDGTLGTPGHPARLGTRSRTLCGVAGYRGLIRHSILDRDNALLPLRSAGPSAIGIQAQPFGPAGPACFVAQTSRSGKANRTLQSISNNKTPVAVMVLRCINHALPAAPPVAGMSPPRNNIYGTERPYYSFTTHP